MFVCLSILNPLSSGPHVTSPFHPFTVMMLLLLSLGVRPKPQDHTGSLVAEEFKACLISLGYDVENDKQVGGPGPPAARAMLCYQAA